MKVKSTKTKAPPKQKVPAKKESTLGRVIKKMTGTADTSEMIKEELPVAATEGTVVLNAAASAPEKKVNPVAKSASLAAPKKTPKRVVVRRRRRRIVPKKNPVFPGVVLKVHPSRFKLV